MTWAKLDQVEGCHPRAEKEPPLGKSLIMVHFDMIRISGSKYDKGTVATRCAGGPLFRHHIGTFFHVRRPVADILIFIEDQPIWTSLLVLDVALANVVVLAHV